MTCQGTSISYDQALQYAGQAGFKGQDAYVITAIAQAESGLCANNTSPPNADGSVDRGPYQLNSKAQAQYSDVCAYDWACAAKAAKSIHDSWGGFGAWTTYTSGKYKQYLPSRLTLNPGNAQNSGVIQQQINTGTTLTNGWQAQLQHMFSSIGEHIAIFAIALVLVIIGVMMLVHKPAEQAIEGAV